MNLSLFSVILSFLCCYCEAESILRGKCEYSLGLCERVGRSVDSILLPGR